MQDVLGPKPNWVLESILCLSQNLIIRFNGTFSKTSYSGLSQWLVCKYQGGFYRHFYVMAIFQSFSGNQGMFSLRPIG